VPHHKTRQSSSKSYILALIVLPSTQSSADDSQSALRLPTHVHHVLYHVINARKKGTAMINLLEIEVPQHLRGLRQILKHQRYPRSLSGPGIVLDTFVRLSGLEISCLDNPSATKKTFESVLLVSPLSSDPRTQFVSTIEGREYVSNHWCLARCQGCQDATAFRISWKLCTTSVLSLDFSLLSNGVNSTTATAPHGQSKCRRHHRQYPSWKRGTICANSEVVMLRCRTKRDGSDKPKSSMNR